MLLNKPIHEIASEFSFITLPRGSTAKDCLYCEEHLEGVKAIIPNSGQDETEVDLELLFNAITIGKLFNNTVL